jgi:hypothetical protein
MWARGDHGLPFSAIGMGRKPLAWIQAPQAFTQGRSQDNDCSVLVLRREAAS